MENLPFDILTDAGFTTDEAHSVAQHLLAGVDLHTDDEKTDPIDLEAMSPGRREAVQRFTMAVAPEV